MKQGCVYILASQKNGTLYTGVTADLCERILQHKSCKAEGFTQKHKVTRLVYFEVFDSMYEAIYREKQIKAWRRQWKIDLIEGDNPDWKELYYDVCE